MGRPIKWTEELKTIAISEIMKRIAGGESCRAILKPETRGEHLPSNRLFIEWMTSDEALRKQYAYACEVRADLIFEDIINISDNKNEDVITDKDGNKVVQYNVIQRDRLRVDARKWMLSKMQPKKYGDKLETVNLNKNEGAITVVCRDEETKDSLDKIIKNAE